MSHAFLCTLIPLPAVLGAGIDPNVTNLVTSVVIALLVFFFGGKSPRK